MAGNFTEKMDITQFEALIGGITNISDNTATVNKLNNIDASLGIIANAITESGEHRTIYAQDVIYDNSNVNDALDSINTNLDSNYTKCLIKKARIQYNGTMGSNHNIVISSQIPNNATYIPMQWGYENYDAKYQLLGNGFAGGALCDCIASYSNNVITLIPRDNRIGTYPYLFVYYWVILS